MISADVFMRHATANGFSLWSGVPCSYLSPFINHVIDSDDLRYVGATNEGDAVAIASGAVLGGSRAVAMFQNSGLGNAVSPLTSLNMVFRIPVLIVVTLRGEPGGPADEPQHEVMGAITTGMLELMGIPWELFPEDERDVAPCIDRAVEHMDEHGTPYALVMRKGAVAPRALQRLPEPRTSSSAAPDGVVAAVSGPRPTRRDVLTAVVETTAPDDLVIATTGYTGRELYAIDDRRNHLYMVGSMGCASSIALGLALAQPDRRVVVLDGDGAMLMRLGALATIGYERPSNLVHLLLDNEMHESTGGQSTVAHSVDAAGIAASCGYPDVRRLDGVDDVRALLGAATTTCTFAHVKIRSGVPDDLPRPAVTPAEVARRFRSALQPAHASAAAGGR
jgi:phosphonopyruvate decarboxylase